MAAAEIVLSHYDRQTSQEQNRSYYKTEFLIEYTGEDGQPCTYERRYDLGDNDGGLVAHVRLSERSSRNTALLRSIRAPKRPGKKLLRFWPSQISWSGTPRLGRSSA